MALVVVVEGEKTLKTRPSLNLPVKYGYPTCLVFPSLHGKRGEAPAHINERWKDNEVEALVHRDQREDRYHFSRIFRLTSLFLVVPFFCSVSRLSCFWLVHSSFHEKPCFLDLWTRWLRKGEEIFDYHVCRTLRALIQTIYLVIGCQSPIDISPELETKKNG